MRIKFKTDIPVDITTIPKSAYGAIGIRHAQTSPSFSSADGINADAEMVETEPATHFFRANWSAILPDDLAQQYIDAGQAEPCTRNVRMFEDVEDMPK